jgi:ribosome assembly protein YihI (activator of Der GTPase)
MKGILNIPYLIDEAHGWIIVTREDLRKARLHPDDFPKAYRTKGEELFALEEDCEMTLLLDKLNSNGVLYQINEKFITHDDKDNPRNWR